MNEAEIARALGRIEAKLEGIEGLLKTSREDGNEVVRRVSLLERGRAQLVGIFSLLTAASPFFALWVKSKLESP